MSFSVKGKNAIVTGAASGINLAFAKLLVSKGCRVVIADIQETEAVRELRKTQGDQYFFKQTDVGDFKALDDLFAFTKSTLGQVDIMCNGAAVYEPSWSNFWTDTETTSYKSIDINVSGLMRGTRLAIRDQIGRGKRSAKESDDIVGVILNISSLVAQLSHFNTPLYCASKAAVSNFTRLMGPMQTEFGIKVVAVAPGIVITPLWTDDKLKAVVSGKDVWITPEELADAMLLVIESKEYPGGTVLEVLKESKRVVAADSPLPHGPGSTVSQMESITQDTLALLRKEQLNSK